MCLFIAQLLMFFGGLYALIAGKVKLTGKQHLTGWRARVAGLFLMAVLPCNVLLELLNGLSSRSEDNIMFLSLVELALVLLALAGVVIFARLTQPRTT